MAAIRENWQILNMRSFVKRYIRNCNFCKAFSTKPCGTNLITPMPRFHTEQSRPFDFTGVYFTWLIIYKVGKKEEAKAYIIIFTCAVMRAIHLEVTKT